MTAVSIVIPSLGDTELLAGALDSLRPVLALRGLGDELLVVDDTGSGELLGFLAVRYPEVVAVPRPTNGGFARALAAGIEAARHPLVFSMNSDLTVRAGFLEPLIEALEDPEVFAAVPRVVRARSGEDGATDRSGSADREARARPGADGSARKRESGRPATEAPGGDAWGQGVESLVRITLDDGRLRLEQPCLANPPKPAPDPELGPLPVPFALGGAMLLRAADFEAMGGFDPLFEPFYLEDVDLCWRAWRVGRKVVYVPGSEVRHLNQGTIAPHVAPELREAVIERNLLLLLWKHLDDQASLIAHLEELERRARSAWVNEERRPLEVLSLAFERLDQALASRAALPRARRTFQAIVERSDPFAAAATLARG